MVYEIHKFRSLTTLSRKEPALHTAPGPSTITFWRRTRERVTEQNSPPTSQSSQPFSHNLPQWTRRHNVNRAARRPPGTAFGIPGYRDGLSQVHTGGGRVTHFPTDLSCLTRFQRQHSSACHIYSFSGRLAAWPATGLVYAW